MTATLSYSHAGVKVAERSPAGVTIVYVDPQGTATFAIDWATLKGTRRYLDPHGNALDIKVGTNPWNAPTGHGYLDKPITTIGLTDMGARDYDSLLGQFTTLDLILDPRDPRSHNGYSYTSGDAVNTMDPTGLASGCADICTSDRDEGRVSSNLHIIPTDSTDAKKRSAFLARILVRETSLLNQNIKAVSQRPPLNPFGGVQPTVITGSSDGLYGYTRAVTKSLPTMIPDHLGSMVSSPIVQGDDALLLLKSMKFVCRVALPLGFLWEFMTSYAEDYETYTTHEMGSEERLVRATVRATLATVGGYLGAQAALAVATKIPHPHAAVAVAVLGGIGLGYLGGNIGSDMGRWVNDNWIWRAYR